MTVHSPSPAGGALHFVVFVFLCCVVLGACSDEPPIEQPLETKHIADAGEDHVTSTTVPPGESSDSDESNPPASPPGTVNDLEDLIENETDDSPGIPQDNSLIERFVAAVPLGEEDGIEITEADARCLGRMLDNGLSATSFELLITNLETINEIEDGNQFTDAKLTVISESFANCLDLRPIVDEVVDDDVALGALVSCLAGNIGVDAIEALVLFEILGENGERLSVPLFLEGLDSCPVEARVAIDERILREFLLADAPSIEACLASISNAELRPFIETTEFSELIQLLRDQCLF